MAACAGVQNVSRPIERCQEMSQMMPTFALVAATSVAATYQGTGAASGAAGGGGGGGPPPPPGGGTPPPPGPPPPPPPPPKILFPLLFALRPLPAGGSGPPPPL